MGWFFNNNRNADERAAQSENQNSGHSFFQSQSSFYSKKRRCQNDPEDNEYIICKTTIKDNNGTREQEERVPKNARLGNGFMQNSSFQSSTFNSFEGQNSPEEKAFDAFPSFFIQPSFFDFHNSYQPGQSNQESFSKSFRQSKTCRPDPQDNEYLICKSKTYDGKDTQQVEERVKLSEQFHVPSFTQGFSSIGHEIDKEMHEIMKDMNLGFNMMMPFIGSMMGFMNGLDPQNFEKNANFQQGPNYGQNQRHGQYRGHEPSDYEDSKGKYFSSNAKKDTKIYDL